MFVELSWATPQMLAAAQTGRCHLTSSEESSRTLFPASDLEDDPTRMLWGAFLQLQSNSSEFQLLFSVFAARK